MKAIILARVSTREQMEEGSSLPSQIRRMRDYCLSKKLDVHKEFEITESSSQQTRKEFAKIIELIKKSKDSIVLVTDTIDRLQRSFRESVILDDFRKQEKLELHFLRENLILNKDSNSADLLRWDMGVMFARSYVLQLSDNVKRSLKEKLANGEIIGKVCLGYKNILGEGGRKDVMVDPERSHLIVKAFELYATGKYSARTLADKMNELGLRNYPSNNPLSPSQMHTVIKNPFYYGEMKRRNGQIYRHKYPPLITRELYDQVQAVISGYKKQNYKRTGKPYVFRGLVKCADCGCSISPEIKKGKYIYYHCTNYHRKCRSVVWVKEEDLLLQVQKHFQKFKLPENAVQHLKEELRAIHNSEQAFFEDNKKMLEQKLVKVQNRYKVMYEDRLDGRLSAEEYDRRLQEYKAQEREILGLLGDHSNANNDFYITAGKIIDLSQRIGELFTSSEPEEKTQLLKFVLQNFSIEKKKLLFETKNPFSGILLLSHSTECQTKLRR